jgi:Family of unknown function (DUF5681)
MSNSRRPKNGDYAVGFAKPPIEHRFKPGISGNPRGRPKGSLNVGTVLERTLLEMVVINEGGQRRTISKLEAAVKQLTNKAASGDLSAVKLLLALIRSAEEREAQQTPAASALGETDTKVMQGMLKRLATSLNKGSV